MKRIDRIYEALAACNKDEKVTASSLADLLGYSRANISNDLNRLCEEGRAEKSGMKPVYYQCKIDATFEDSNEFDHFLNMNPSLASCGEMAKAAVLYPPHGMHIMLTGETGVGKSMFAELIFRYAVERRRIDPDRKLIAFNCADYANNPQLIMGQLFGVIKGAYTGADQDRPGLLEQADGSILFLDEVHRLPPEGQEMLFSYIDQGHYRRLGETDNRRSGRVMLICATTENPEAIMLQTFLRRIPMLIKIPNLDERGLRERLSLISSAFKSESQRVHNPIEASMNSIRALLGYQCKNNVGQLKTDIQLLCAKAYSDYVSQKKNCIRVSSFDLPPHIRNGLFAETNRKQIWSLLAGITTHFIRFDANFKEDPFISAKSTTDIYQIIEQSTEDLCRVGSTQVQIDEDINSILENYYRQYEGNEEVNDLSSLEHLVGGETMATANKVLALAGKELGKKFDKNIYYGLSLHIHNAIKRLMLGQTIVNPRLQNIQNETPHLLQVAKQSLTIIEEDFNVKFPQDEAGFIAMFFKAADETLHGHAKVQIIVIAHGKGIASGLAETANRLLGAVCIYGFDMPLDENQSLTYSRIRDHISNQKNVQEVLLMVDMGSLADFRYTLEQELNIRTKCFLLVSTIHVLEAGRKAMLGYSLYDIYEDIRRVTALTLSDWERSKSKSLDQKLYLLTVCTTGEGSARMLKEHLNEHLNLHDSLCEIIALQFSNRHYFEEQVEQLCVTGRVIGIISSFQTGLPAEHFKISQSLNESGIARIQDRVDMEATFIQVGQKLAQSVDSLRDGYAIHDIRSTLERISRSLGRQMDSDIAVGAFCHIGYMFDRLKRGIPLNECPRRQEISEKYPEEVKLIQHEFREFGEKHSIIIPLDEVCFLAAFFFEEDLIS